MIFNSPLVFITVKVKLETVRPLLLRHLIQIMSGVKMKLCEP